jgi:short-subunit dehydrogenase
MAATFRDNVVVITGASEGIGRELALQLAGAGARLILAARNEDRLQEAARDCAARGGRALAVPTDVSEQQACRTLIETAVRAHGRLDTCINNAGISMYAPFAALVDPAMVERIVRINFLGSVFCTSYALPYLKQSHGRIVAISSLVGKISGPGGTGYVASKHAQRGFFDSLRAELRSAGVSVTMAYPGFVRTEIYKRFLDARGQFGPDMSSRIPAWTMMPVERMARRILRAVLRRRREVPPTLFDRAVIGLNRLIPGLVDRFWQQTLARDFPMEPGSSHATSPNPEESTFRGP